MALHGKTTAKIRAAVAELKSFTIGNVSGRRVLLGTGRLPHEYVGPLREAWQADQIKYVLYSYGTPMAWLLDDVEGEHWVQPAERYSVSTSGHQSVFARAIRERVSA
jgi:hypothetical protein